MLTKVVTSSCKVRRCNNSWSPPVERYDDLRQVSMHSYLILIGDKLQGSRPGIYLIDYLPNLQESRVVIYVLPTSSTCSYHLCNYLLRRIIFRSFDGWYKVYLDIYRVPILQPHAQHCAASFPVSYQVTSLLQGMILDSDISCLKNGSSIIEKYVNGITQKFGITVFRFFYIEYF